MADAPLAVVPFVAGAAEAARLIDAEARPLASIPEPARLTPVSTFREAALAAAFAHEGGADVAGVLFASRWGGGGVPLT